MPDLPVSSIDHRRRHGEAAIAPAGALADAPGTMARLIREHDWSATPLGPIKRWSGPLRSAVSLMLRCPQPVFVAWGPELISLYNEAQLPLLGDRHPHALGTPARPVWSELWDAVSAPFDAAMAGQAQWCEDVPLELGGAGQGTRWFSYSCTPIEDEHGAICGLMSVAHETTAKVLAERRLALENARRERMLEHSPGYVFKTTGRGHVLDFVNAAHRELFDSGQWIGQAMQDVIPGPAGQEQLQQMDRVFATGERRVVREASVVRSLGPGHAATLYLDFVYEPLLGDGGEVVGILCQGSDVTDRVSAVRAVAAGEERYRQIVEGAEEFAIITMDRRGVITSWNTGAERMLGYSEREAVGRPGAIFFTDEDRCHGAPQRELDTAALDGRAVNERWHMRKDRSLFWGSGLLMRMDAPGNAFLKIFRDRTQAHVHESALARRSQQLQELAQTALEVTRAGTVVGTLAAITRAARRIVGAHQVMVSLTQDRGWSQAINSVELSDKYSKWRDFAVMPRGEGIYALVCEHNRPLRLTQEQLEAHPRWRAFSGHAAEHPPLRGWLAVPLVGRDGRNLGVVQLSDKVDGSEFDGADEAMLVQLAQVASAAIEQSSTEAALRQSEEQLRLAAEATEIGLWDVDVLAGKVFWQPRLKQMFGMAPDQEVSMDDFFAGLHADDRQAAVDAVEAAMDPKRRSLYDLEYRTVRGDGTQRWVAAKGRCVFDDSGQCVRMIGTAIDVTDRKNTEAQLRNLNETLERRVEEQSLERMKAEDALRQAHKMEAVGQLTGGIAHDFNNMLGAVVGSFELILRKPGDPERVQRYAESGLQAADRGTRLTSQLLAFSRAQQIEMKPLVVSSVVESMRDMLVNALGPMVRLTVDLQDDPVRVLADSTQLEMAVLNLAINARDAMPEGGIVRIGTRVQTVRHDPELPDGDYVELCVSDPGAGMDAEVVARAFEPFFTTKGVGKGTGLGLSQVYGIARLSGGTVRLESEPGAGTTVRILLPCVDGCPGEDLAPTPGEAAVLKNLVTVLVVDDDRNVREVLVETLDALGYRVLQAEDGPAGLAVLEREVPDLLMLDFAMPGMNGAEVARAALARSPGLPIVFATGYADTAAIVEVAGPDALVLRKPFRVNELQAMLEMALESRR